MKKMKRAIVLTTIFAVMIFTSTLASFATVGSGQADVSENPIEIGVFWANVNSIILDLDFAGKTVTCSGRISGKTNVNSITATFTLKRVNSNGTTTTLETWSELSSNTRTLNFSETYLPVSVG